MEQFVSFEARWPSPPSGRSEPPADGCLARSHVVLNHGIIMMVRRQVSLLCAENNQQPACLHRAFHSCLLLLRGHGFVKRRRFFACGRCLYGLSGRGARGWVNIALSQH